MFSAEAEPLGFGAYHIRISSVHAFDGQKDFTCKVVKGEQQQGINRQWFFKTPLAGVFYERGPSEVVFVDDNGVEHREQQADSREKVLDVDGTTRDTCDKGGNTRKTRCQRLC